MADEELISIERDLTQGRWTPSEDEKSLGGALFARKQRVESEAQQHPADMPNPKDEWDLFLTQAVTARARLARELSEELLPVWRDRLSDSPMLRLVEKFTTVCEKITPFSDRLLDAWRTSPPPPPTPETVASEAQRLRVSLPEAEENTRYFDARRWEEQQLTKEEHAQVNALLHRAGTIATMIYAASTGEIGY
ncbi:hypothetical protein [Streptomyces abikoensis]